jgi:hypothetical protein
LEKRLNTKSRTFSSLQKQTVFHGVEQEICVNRLARSDPFRFSPNMTTWTFSLIVTCVAKPVQEDARDVFLFIMMEFDCDFRAPTVGSRLSRPWCLP